jgi:hypothetical protein
VSNTNNARRIDDAHVLFSTRCLEKKFLRVKKYQFVGVGRIFLHGGASYVWVGWEHGGCGYQPHIPVTHFFNPNLQREIKRAMIQCDASLQGDACQSCGLDVKVAPNTPPENHAWRGVSYERDAGKWRSRIYCLGKFVTLGRFRSSEDAAMCHDMAAYYIHGERALTNHELCAVREFYQSGLAFASSNVMARLSVLKQAAKAGRDAGLLVRCNLASMGRHVAGDARRRRLGLPPIIHGDFYCEKAGVARAERGSLAQARGLRLVILAASRM